MAIGVNSIMHMGVGALFASQANIQVTGNNIANVNTEGYSRQRVLQQDNFAIDYYPGQIGQGVEATQVIRYFDKFIESAYLDRASMQSRYQQEYSILRSVETVFNEANDTPGIGSALTALFNSFTTLAQDPGLEAVRVALLESAKTLGSSIRNVDNTIAQIQEEMETRIRDDVARADTLMKEIAQLNREINIHTIENRNNANQLMDLRDQKTRELGQILDIRVEDKGAGKYNITTGGGQVLVQEDISFSLSFDPPKVSNNLMHNSAYDGTLGFNGSDGYEYTVEVVKGGTVDKTGIVPPADPDTAQYRVSLDGGKSWIMDEATGRPKIFYATDEAHSTGVKDLDLYFTQPYGTLTAGDKFTVSPKSEVYWVSPTSDPINISSQTYANGTENTRRITGGRLAAYLDVRDNKLGQYRDRIAELTDTLTWEVNRIHSQGAGLEPLHSALGTYSVGRADVPLGSPSSGFHWASRLQAGNMTFSVYDPETGKPLELNGAVQGFDVFSPENFDPSTHSMRDVVGAINSGPAGQYMTASIVDGKLNIEAKIDPVSGKQYGFGISADTSGLAAAFGINTFFEGDTPSSFGVRAELTENTNLINAGRINGAAEGNVGDNITAKEIAELAEKVITIGGVSQTIVDHYAGTVVKVGSDTQSAQYKNIAETTMTNELQSRKDEISSVSLDEEMSNLIRFQASYKAAAKLITTADEMLQTLLSLK